MNLNTALTGRMRRHDKLLEHSGFTRFVDAFADWTRQHDNQHHHLSEVKDTVKSLWYDPVIARLKKLVDTNDGSEAQLRDTERTLVGQKNRMHAEAYALVEREVSALRSNIGDLMSNSGSTEEANGRLRNLVHPVITKVERWLNEELQDVDASIKVTVSAPQMSGDRTAGRAGVDYSAGVRDSVVKRVGELVTDKETVKNVLITGRGMKTFGIRDLLGLKGKWVRTFDKWANGFTKLARGGMAVLQVGLALWDAKRAHDQQEQMNQEMRRLTVEGNQAIESTCGELKKDLTGGTDNVIEDTLGAAIVRIQKQLADMTKGRSEKDRHYQELLTHRSQLEGIVFTSSQTETSS